MTYGAVTRATCSLSMEPLSCLCASAYTFASSTLLVSHGLHRPSEFKLSHLEKEGNKSNLKEVKASAWNMGDLGSIPGLGRSPGEENGNPLQYSCLENPMEGGAW